MINPGGIQQTAFLPRVIRANIVNYRSGWMCWFSGLRLFSASPEDHFLKLRLLLFLFPLYTRMWWGGGSCIDRSSLSLSIWYWEQATGNGLHPQATLVCFQNHLAGVLVGNGMLGLDGCVRIPQGNFQDALLIPRTGQVLNGLPLKSVDFRVFLMLARNVLIKIGKYDWRRHSLAFSENVLSFKLQF